VIVRRRYLRISGRTQKVVVAGRTDGEPQAPVVRTNRQAPDKRGILAGEEQG
jgi:hypothetical protein